MYGCQNLDFESPRNYVDCRGGAETFVVNFYVFTTVNMIIVKL